ncbi:MAG: Ribulose-phosphate 3-epimerase [candidate division WWE3 bacterium GW2011_GWF2_41_45]|nr:MAG: Ribulose-phosphate 3-epimerase [candidate division WWE3 bacterium GW2011_GWF2_41_45]
MNKKYLLSASLICANHLEFGKEVVRLEKGNIDYIHFDVMDGNFVPRYGLYPELLASIKKISPLMVDVHMMAEDPGRYIKEFAEAGANIIAVHVETCKHLHFTLKQIRGHGVKAGVVLNYATPLSVLDYVLDDIDMVELMAINPGIVGHKMIPGIFKKISDLKEKINASGKNILIEIDGGVNPDTAADMIRAGADILVCGTSSIFKLDVPVNKKIGEFRKIIDNKLKNEI